MRFNSFMSTQHNKNCNKFQGLRINAFAIFRKWSQRFINCPTVMSFDLPLSWRLLIHALATTLISKYFFLLSLSLIPSFYFSLSSRSATFHDTSHFRLSYNLREKVQLFARGRTKKYVDCRCKRKYQ